MELQTNRLKNREEGLSSIFKEETLSQISILGELTLDRFLNDGILKDIDVFGSLFSVLRIGNGIKEYFFGKKIIKFINKINESTIYATELAKFRDRLNNDAKYRNKVVEFTFITIDRLNEENIASIFGRLFSSYINNQYSWSEMCYIAKALEQMYVIDIEMLNELGNILNTLESSISIDEVRLESYNSDMAYSSIERLKNYGFMNINSNTVGAVRNYLKSQVWITETGRKFIELCI